MLSSPSSPKPSPRVPRIALLFFLTLSFLGFVDAAYLSVEHYLGGTVPCALTGGCETVLTSKYAVVFGVPVSLIGSLYYLAIFFATVLYLSAGNDRALRFASWLTILGFLTSLGLVYLQLSVIRAICLYCMVSAATSIVLFGAGMVFLRNLRRSMPRAKE